MPAVKISYIRQNRLRRAFTEAFGGDFDDAVCALNLYLHDGWEARGAKFWGIGCSSARVAAFRYLSSLGMIRVNVGGTSAEPTRKLISFFDRELGDAG